MPSPGLHWSPAESLSQLPPYKTGNTIIGYVVTGCDLPGINGYYYVNGTTQDVGKRIAYPMYVQPDIAAFCTGQTAEGCYVRVQ